MSPELKIVAHIRTDFKGKFGIPRQSGLVDLEAVVEFEPNFRREEAVRGLEGFSHLWLLWLFSKSGGSLTVRPPRLGGNARLGVFATRSPFRPNPLGLSCVKLLGIERGSCGPKLRVSGADMADGTPILDIKPYLPYADSHPDATCGFAGEVQNEKLEVEISEGELEKIPEAKRSALLELLAEDPRPHYQHDPERLYGFSFAGFEVRFKVEGKRLTVTEIA